MTERNSNAPGLLILGATSAMAQATARRYAPTGGRLFLAARDPDKLESVARDMKSRGAAEVTSRVFDATNADDHTRVVNEAKETLGNIDIALIAFGTLPEQENCESEAQQARDALDVNFVSAVSLLTPLANLMEKQGHGSIAVISSVAGDRGRRSNYVYGSAKAGLSAFCEGLQIRLAASGVKLLVVKPGLVTTPMTAHLDKSPLWAEPARVGKDIERAIARGRRTIYTPWFWRCIMWIIKSIPPAIFAKLPL